jgi:hypothetical protein
MSSFATTSARVPRATARDGRPAPRWAVVAAHLVPLTTIGSGLWRLPLAAGFSMGLITDGVPAHAHGWESVSIVCLSLAAELAALLTLGLVRPWGERVPRWIPLLGGRRIPATPVVAIAGAGAVALQVIWTFAFVNFVVDSGMTFSSPVWEAVLIAAYLPLLAWAPLLGAVTWAYWRRRCGSP